LDLKVLVLAPFYRAFVKGLVEPVSELVASENVIIHHNQLSEISNTRLIKHLPIRYLNWVGQFTKDKLLNVKDKPSNVHVHLLSVFYFVPDGRNRKLGDTLFDEIDKLIQKQRIKFDIIHAHHTWPRGYAAIKLGEKYNIPTVVTIHENQELFLKEYSSHSKIYKFVWENADALIRVNPRDITLLKKFNQNTHYIPNGFSPKKFYTIGRKKARGILEFPRNKKVLFSLGDLIERKGFHYLADAIAEIVKARMDVLCIIGGSGPMRKKLKKRINKLNLQEYVKLVGFIPDKDLTYWMNAADVFVLPSLSEGNPTVMFEALGVGLPFVGTKVGGVPEIITSEDYGLLVEPANPEDLAEKILIALEKEWDRGKIKKYAEQFTWENIAKRTVKVYEEIKQQ